MALVQCPLLNCPGSAVGAPNQCGTNRVQSNDNVCGSKFALLFDCSIRSADQILCGTCLPDYSQFAGSCVCEAEFLASGLCGILMTCVDHCDRLPEHEWRFPGLVDDPRVRVGVAALLTRAN